MVIGLSSARKTIKPIYPFPSCMKILRSTTDFVQLKPCASLRNVPFRFSPLSFKLRMAVFGLFLLRLSLTLRGVLFRLSLIRISVLHRGGAVVAYRFRLAETVRCESSPPDPFQAQIDFL